MMKLLQIYNQYRSLFGGEETVVQSTARLVSQHGGETRLLMKSSRGLDESIGGRFIAAASGIYNPFASRAVSRYVEEFRPDVAHVHNLFPLFSPSVLVALNKANVPVVMTVHNHFHTCPIANHFFNGSVCERCVGGREYNCILQNCRENLFESVAYAIRSTIARKLRLFTEYTSIVIALNEFAKSRLLIAGFDTQRVTVLPNMVDIPDSPTNAASGSYGVFSGRMCPEKGVATLIEAARLALDVPIRLLGDGPTFREHQAGAPPNVQFLGQLPPDEVAKQYRGARFLVIPSLWFEGSPLVVAEAMSHGLPVIASRIGGLPDLVDEGRTGLLFDPGNAIDLANKIKMLWGHPDLCGELGHGGRLKAVRDFSEAAYWDRLRQIYVSAVNMRR